jgi:hypothetical protein
VTREEPGLVEANVNKDGCAGESPNAVREKWW